MNGRIVGLLVLTEDGVEHVFREMDDMLGALGLRSRQESRIRANRLSGTTSKAKKEMFVLEVGNMADRGLAVTYANGFPLAVMVINPEGIGELEKLVAQPD